MSSHTSSFFGYTGTFARGHWPTVDGRVSTEPRTLTPKGHWPVALGDSSALYPYTRSLEGYWLATADGLSALHPLLYATDASLLLYLLH